MILSMRNYKNNLNSQRNNQFYYWDILLIYMSTLCTVDRQLKISNLPGPTFRNFITKVYIVIQYSCLNVY